MRFRDRTEAGRQLAQLVLRDGVGIRDAVVLALPRGGVPVALEIARALAAPLDVIVVRKLGVPFQPELAMGAIGEGGVWVENREVMRSAGLHASDVEAVERHERVELERRARLYRGDRSRLDLRAKCVVIVDDGIATGSSARAACQVARALGATRILLAVPVASRHALTQLHDVCDDVICVEVPEPFYAVGEWYQDFSQTSDDQVVELLGRADDRTERREAKGPGAVPPARDDEISFRSGRVRLTGRLTIPARPIGVVVFAHGSGSSRHSPRNRYVAGVLNGAGVATLLVDLLTAEEERQRASVFDVPMLAERLGDATRWTGAQEELVGLGTGYCGASTGAAAALWAAAQPGCSVAAIVLRGGRPDLAASLLSSVRAPTLLIVGGRDEAVLELNRKAQTDLRGESRVTVVPGATHLFAEPGALELVAELARDWFVARLGAGPARGGRLP